MGRREKPLFLLSVYLTYLAEKKKNGFQGRQIISQHLLSLSSFSVMLVALSVEDCGLLAGLSTGRVYTIPCIQ